MKTAGRLHQDLARALEAAGCGPLAWAGPGGRFYQKSVGRPFPELAELASQSTSNLELLSASLGWYSSLAAQEVGSLVVVLDEPLKGALLQRLETAASRGEDVLLLWLDLARRYTGPGGLFQDTRSSLEGGLLARLGIEFLGTADLEKPEKLHKTLQSALQKTGPRLLHLLGSEDESEEDVTETEPHLAGEILERIAEDFRADSDLRIFWTLPRSPGPLYQLGKRLRPIDPSSCLHEARGAAAARLYPIVVVTAEVLPELLPGLFTGLTHPLTLLVLNGGLSFNSGETVLHPARLRDLSILRLISGLAVAVPCDLEDGMEMLKLARSTETPVAIRLTSVPPIGFPAVPSHMQPGKARALRKGSKMALLALGSTVFPSLLAAEALGAWGADCSVYDVRFLKPFDLELLREIASSPRLLTVEEHCVQGGLHTTVLEAWQLLDLPPIPIHGMGLPIHPPIEAGSTLEQYDLHAEGIQRRARQCLGLERSWT